MDTRHLEIEIPPNKSKERIDVFLAREVARLSRNQIQLLCRDGRVTVFGKSVKPNYITRPHDVVVLELPKPERHDLEPQAIPLTIVYEDDHLLVIDKPAGMVVHPAHGHADGTLVNALLHHCGRLSGLNHAARPGIVHRLDKDTSGLLVAAKENAVHGELAKQFSAKSVRRQYTAIVWRHFKEKAGRVETFLNRSARDRKIFTVAKNGKNAVTHYQVEREFDFLTRASLQLETGRTHQIRVHLSHLGHPVFGDQTYGGRTRPMGGMNRERTAFARSLLEIMQRQALHAQTLGFVHPITKEELFFTSELPEDMAAVLGMLEEKLANQS